MGGGGSKPGSAKPKKKKGKLVLPPLGLHITHHTQHTRHTPHPTLVQSVLQLTPAAPAAPKPPPTPPPAPAPEWEPLGLSKSAMQRFLQRFASNDFTTLNMQQVGAWPR